MREENYWLRRLRSGHLSRRRFVGGAAATGLGAAALGLVGCGDDDDDDDTGGNTPQATGTSATGSATASATQAATAQKGGTAHLVSANNTWDTFDIDRSRFSPVAWLFGLTNLGIVQWKSFVKPEIEGAIAESWEQADDGTTVFKLRPNVFWHNKPPVNGRQTTADDIKYFIDRNRIGKTLDGKDDPNFYRKAALQNVDKVEVTDPTTVKVTFTKPDPFFLNTLAGSYSKVQAREAIEKWEGEYQNLSADKIIGTGGFVLDEFAAEGRSKWSRNEKFYQQVNWDGIEWLPLFTDQAAQQAAFEQKQIDAFGPTQNSVIEDLTNRLKGQITETKAFAGNPQAGTYYGGAAPWNNKNLIGAIFRAVPRRDMIQSLLQGKAVLAGNVPPAQQAFTIDEKELTTFPGYLEDRAADEAEAKKMWDAGGGASLGEVIVDIPDIWEGLYSGGAALICNKLSSVLGTKFTPKIEPYSTITTKIVQQKYGGSGGPNIWFGWVTELTDIEPTVLNYLSYNSASPQWPQFSVKNDKIDQITLAALSEFDITKRQNYAKDFVREALKDWGAGIPYSLNGITTVLSWNYFKFPEASAFVQQHMYATKYYFDQNDPTWKGRA
ncbi:MAG: ABC transporter substrate-binding protein [Hyphomicrobiales bacterium]